MALPDDGSRPGPDSSGQRPPTTDPRRRWLIVGLVIAVLAAIVLSQQLNKVKAKSITYSQFLGYAAAGEVQTATVSNSDGTITGTVQLDGVKIRYTSNGPVPTGNEAFMAQLAKQDKFALNYGNPAGSLLSTLLPYLFFLGIIILMVVLIGRQTRSQMSGIMSIGRSRAKLFSEDRPTTTFADVAGYEGVKQEISEVVDFLKSPVAIPGHRREDPEGRPAHRAPRDRQDAHGARGRR